MLQPSAFRLKSSKLLLGHNWSIGNSQSPPQSDILQSLPSLAARHPLILAESVSATANLSLNQGSFHPPTLRFARVSRQQSISLSKSGLLQSSPPAVSWRECDATWQPQLQSLPSLAAIHPLTRGERVSATAGLLARVSCYLAAFKRSLRALTRFFSASL
jgi:hypothetical protein